MVFLQSWLWKQNGGQCDWAYGEINEVGGPVIPGNNYLCAIIYTFVLRLFRKF